MGPPGRSIASGGDPVLLQFDQLIGEFLKRRDRDVRWRCPRERLLSWPGNERRLHPGPRSPRHVPAVGGDEQALGSANAAVPEFVSVTREYFASRSRSRGYGFRIQSA